MLKLSPSSLRTFAHCPLCFWLQFRRDIKHPDTPFPSLPNGMDKILKAHFDSFRARNTLPPELKQLDDIRLFDDMDLLKKWRINWEGIQHLDGDVLLRGAVDDILVKGERLIVLDFKTRGFPAKPDTHTYYQDQLNLYNYLLRKNGFDTEPYAYLIFYHPDRVNQDGSVRFEDELKRVDVDVEAAERLFQDAVACLRSDEEPAAAEGCGHCRFVGERG